MRTCCWEARFTTELKRLEPNEKRADDLIFGIDWVLARDPKSGVSIPSTQVWYIAARDIPKKRHLVIFYTFSAEKVFFLSVVQTPINSPYNHAKSH
jgi:hypothetical protein